MAERDEEKLDSFADDQDDIDEQESLAADSPEEPNPVDLLTEDAGDEDGDGLVAEPPAWVLSAEDEPELQTLALAAASRDEEPEAETIVPDAPPAGEAAASYRGQNLRGQDLRTIRGAGADFCEADLTGVDLRGAVLVGAQMQRAVLRDAILEQADLSECDLGGADLRGARLRRAILRSAELGAADLNGCDMSGADLEGANLSGANLARAILVAARLSGANLTRANLTAADARQALLMHADLTGATAPMISLCEALLDSATALLADFGEADFSGARAPMARFDRAAFPGARFIRFSAPTASFEFADLRSAVLENCVLWRAVMTGASLDDARADGCDMREVDLLWASLTRFSHARCDMHGVRFSEAHRTAHGPDRTPPATRPIVPLYRVTSTAETKAAAGR